MKGNFIITRSFAPRPVTVNPLPPTKVCSSSAGSAPINSTVWDNLLPSRIFATDRYPDARLNVYSRPDILCFIVHVLKGTPELKKIMNSCFGPLFTIPVHRCSISGKLIHALLCRQLVTKQEEYDEMWTVFGGQPMRFSLVEFGAVTGLPCGEFPEGYDPDLDDPAPLSHEKHYWDKLIGDDNREFTLADVASILEDKEIEEDGDRKLRLALLLIVDGVLVASHQRNRPTFKYVAMLEDVDSFLSFPWGRESFLKTISTMRPATAKKTTGKPYLKRLKRDAKCKDPLASFTDQLQQQSIRLNGFPLALQLLAFRNVSGLVDKIPGSLVDSPTFIEWDSLLLPKSYLTLSHVHNVECSSNVSVDPWIHCDHREEVVKDKKVAYMVAQILNGHIFTKNEWPGGFSSLPLIKVSEKKPPDVSHRKHIVSRRKNTPASMRVKQPTSTSKQRTRRRSKRHCVINNKDHDYPVDLEDLIQSEIVSVRNEFSLTVQKLQSRFTKLENKFKALKFQKSRKFRRLSSHRSSKKNRSSLKEDPPHPSGSRSPNMTDTRVEDEVHIQLSPRTLAAQGVKHNMKKYCQVFGTEDCGSDSPCEDSTAGGNPIYNTARQNEQTIQPPPNLPKTSSSSEPMPIYNTASSFPHMLKDSNAPDEAQTQSAIAVSSEFPSPQLAITNAPLTVCKGSKSNLTQGETSEGHKQVSPEGEPITSGGQTQDFAEGAPGTGSPPFSSVLASSIITTAKNRTSRAASLGGVQPPNISYSGSRVNVSADTSLPNNPMGQSPRLHFPSCIDICHYELEKLTREQGTLRKNFEETTSELKAELERKMAEVFSESDRKFQEIVAAYNAQAKKVESVRSLVAMNSLLANAYRSTCPVKSAATGTAAVRAARSSQHSTQQQQAVQSNTHMSSTQSSVTAVEALIPNLSGPFSHIPRCNTPQPIPISQPPLVQSNTHINSTTLPRPSVTAEAISLHSPSSNMPQPPLISKHTPSSYSTPSAPPAHGIIRHAMAPHLRSSRPPNSAAPSTTYPRLVQQQQEEQQQQENSF